MQDRKALQAGTSHFLGQNFAKASQIKFQSAEEKEEYAWTTSWGVSTRLIGGVIMTHGDDDGMVMPPRVASAHVVLLPIIRNDDERQAVMAYTDSLARELRDKRYYDRPLTVEVDPRDIARRSGWEWIKKGIPLRVEIGSREIKDNAVFLGRRDKPHNERASLKRDAFTAEVTGHPGRHPEQDVRPGAGLPRSKHGPDRRQGRVLRLLHARATSRSPRSTAASPHRAGAGTRPARRKINEDLSVTIRCIPFEQEGDPGRCLDCGRPGQHRVVFAKAY